MVASYFPFMIEDPILRLQLPYIAKIVQDETWLEAERRRCPVPPSDPVVRLNVCAVILRIGAALREQVSRELAKAQAPDSIGGRAA